MTLPSFDKGFPVEVHHTYAFYVYCIAGYCKNSLCGSLQLANCYLTKFVMWKVGGVGTSTGPVVPVLGTAHQQYRITGIEISITSG